MCHAGVGWHLCTQGVCCHPSRFSSLTRKSRRGGLVGNIASIVFPESFLVKTSKTGKRQRAPQKDIATTNAEGKDVNTTLHFLGNSDT